MRKNPQVLVSVKNCPALNETQVVSYSCLGLASKVTFTYVRKPITRGQYAWVYKNFIYTQQRLNKEHPNNNQIYDHSKSVSLFLDAVLVKIQLYKICAVLSLSNSFYFFNKSKNNTMLQTFKSHFYVTHSSPELELNSVECMPRNFYWWFVGFSDGEACFMIVLKKDKQGNLKHFEFSFVIGLHRDDSDALTQIQTTLKLGRITLTKSKCIFVVNKQEELNKLISIFDKYNLNTTKYLDYIDFKKAFFLYYERDTLVTEELKNKIIAIKNGMNKSRSNFNLPTNHEININKYWLLGLIEGEGSFYLDRVRVFPGFSIKLTERQLPVLEKIKEYIINNLGFDAYSILKLKSSSVISINKQKAINKSSKPTVILHINNIYVLNNFVIPFLNELNFITKKRKDFNDFKLICKAVYSGADRRPEIKTLILKLSLTMNYNRLSTNSVAPLLTTEERDAIRRASPTLEQLSDGREWDISLNKIIHKHSTCLYEITNLVTGEVIINQTITDSAQTIGVTYRTLTKYMNIEKDNSIAEVKNYQIKRIGIFLLVSS